MDNILSTLFPTNQYRSQTDIVKAQFLYSIISLVIVLTFFNNTVNLLADQFPNVLYPISTIIVILGIYGLIRYNYLDIASWILLLTSFFTLIAVFLFADYEAILTLLFDLAILLLAGFLLGNRGIFVFTALNVIQIILLPEIIVSNSDNNLPILIQALSVYFITGFILYIFNRFVVVSRTESQDVEGLERLKLADVNMRITRLASSRESLKTALDTTIDLILKNYPDIYHAQVFLIDQKGIQARLEASTGDVGQRLLEKNHALAIGSLSVIGQVTLNGEVVVARANDPNNVHRPNDLLQDTTLEVAFPLKVNEIVIGALDLQSKVIDQLSENDRLTFQSLANSLSLAIDSIRQFDDAAARVEENQRLTEQTRSALREVERLNQRLIGRAWTNYARGMGDDLGLITDFDAETTSPYSGWSDTLVEAIHSGNFVQEDNLIALPLRIRGQIVGALEFELGDNQELSHEDFDLINEVSERFGLAAENTRLVEESQRTAQREALINQVASRFQSAQNVEATLAEAARSISEALEASKVLIRLGEPTKAPHGKDS
ncbi:MAG: hypothetical protein Phog2KO_06750 [Phototrophicaceae bacterium]